MILMLVMGIDARPEAVSKKSPSIFRKRFFKVVEWSVKEPCEAICASEIVDRITRRIRQMRMRVFMSSI